MFARIWLLGAFTELRKTTITSSCLSLRVEHLGSHLTVFMKFDV